MTRIREEED